MSVLAHAAQNMLAQKSSVTSLLGSNAIWSTWIFVDSPNAMVENTQSCLVVISQNGSWANANDHNTARFPQLIVDVWADPTRNSDGSVKKPDAKNKVVRVFDQIDKYLHLVNKSNPDGSSIVWGTASEIANKTGVRISDSVRASGDIEFSPTFDNKGGWMGRMYYNISV